MLSKLSHLIWVVSEIKATQSGLQQQVPSWIGFFSEITSVVNQGHHTRLHTLSTSYKPVPYQIRHRSRESQASQKKEAKAKAIGLSLQILSLTIRFIPRHY